MHVQMHTHAVCTASALAAELSEPTRLVVAALTQQPGVNRSFPTLAIKSGRGCVLFLSRSFEYLLNGSQTVTIGLRL